MRCARSTTKHPEPASRRQARPRACDCAPGGVGPCFSRGRIQMPSNAGGQKAVVKELSKLLASTYTLYLKTQNYHWNVTGPLFTSLHSLFETQYTELAAAVDEIAERIRALGARAPGSFAEFAKLSVVEEAAGERSANDMIGDLVDDQKAIADLAKSLIEAAEKAGDHATADLATARVLAHEKNAWMLRSHLE